MSSPHDHNAIIQSLKEQQAEVKTPLVRRKGSSVSIGYPTPIKEPAAKPEEEIMPTEVDTLDEELAALEAAIPEAEEVLIETNEDHMRKQLLELLHSHPDCPSEEQISAWKAKHGENGVQVMSLDPENIFIFTYLTLSQWEKVQALSEKLQASGGNPNVEKSMKEAVVRTAVLWPKLPATDPFQGKRAGLLSTLFDQILINSYFLSPAQAMTLTTKL